MRFSDIFLLTNKNIENSNGEWYLKLKSKKTKTYSYIKLPTYAVNIYENTRSLVPAHDMQGSDQRQLIENIDAADVARMNDPLTPLQRGKRLRAEQTMGIGNHANLHATLQTRFKQWNLQVD